MTQCEHILEMLKLGPVDQMMVLRKIGCARLAARILDLKKEGHSIVTETVHKRGKTYAVYHLIEKKEELA